MKKHWKILKGDEILGPLLPSKPNIVYRRNLTLKDKLAPSAIDLPPKISMFGSLKGFFPCRKCKVCRTSQTIRTSSFSARVTSKVYNIKDFITCGTVGVVYLLICPCGLQYVGRTTCALNVRIEEYLGNIRRGFIGHSVSKHFRLHHDRNSTLLKVIAIEKFTPHWRGNNLKRHKLDGYMTSNVIAPWDSMWNGMSIVILTIGDISDASLYLFWYPNYFLVYFFIQFYSIF